MGREILVLWVEDALVSLGGKAGVIDVAKEVWRQHRTDLTEDKDLFYTWQYDMRWAALKLRKTGVLEPADKRTRAWVLAR